MYADLESLREFTDNTEATDAQLTRAERIARLIIDSICGQSFTYEPNVTINVRGSGESNIKLPKRLVSMSGISWQGVQYNNSSFLIRGDGWYLARPTGTILTIKQAPSEEALDNLVYWSTGPIYVPGYNYSNFSADIDYIVTGNWGWETVPEDIILATQLLVESYLCGDFVYWNKNVSIARTVDWHLQFFASGGTGNKLVDQLLAKYKDINMAVI